MFIFCSAIAVFEGWLIQFVIFLHKNKFESGLSQLSTNCHHNMANFKYYIHSFVFQLVNKSYQFKVELKTMKLTCFSLFFLLMALYFYYKSVIFFILSISLQISLDSYHMKERGHVENAFIDNGTTTPLPL